MKKIIILITVTVLILSCVSNQRNNKNSLNWAGLYRGDLPAADIAGMSVEIQLNNDSTYRITYKYLGRDELFVNSGSFNWNNAGDTIKLDREIPPYYFRVEENRLIQLDMDGNAITGIYADYYILMKVNE